MDMIANPVLFTIGVALLVTGYVLLRRAKGQSVVDATRDAAWKSVWKRDGTALRQQLETTVSVITSEPTTTAVAKKIAGMGAREAMSRVSRVAGIISILGGLIIVALGMSGK